MTQNQGPGEPRRQSRHYEIKYGINHVVIDQSVASENVLALYPVVNPPVPHASGSYLVFAIIAGTAVYQ